jgi:transcriptional regulator with XRE-family HTH domain
MHKCILPAKGADIASMAMNTAKMTAEIIASGWTQARVGEYCGVSQSTVARWLTGKDPEGPNRDRLLQLYRDVVSADVPLPDLPPSRSMGGATVRIPDLAIFGGLGGGGMLEVMQDESGALIDGDQLRGYWTFPDYMVSAFRNLRRIYAWEVRGDSMEPTLAGGSVVFVDMSQDKLPPDDIYAIDYGDGLMVKRLKLIPRSDKVAVISDNERYGTDELLRDEVRVYGRIVGWFQWRK